MHCPVWGPADKQGACGGLGGVAEVADEERHSLAMIAGHWVRLVSQAGKQFDCVNLFKRPDLVQMGQLVAEAEEAA
jgi:hypothetical protein